VSKAAGKAEHQTYNAIQYSMKPYAGGRLPNLGKKTKIIDYMRGSKKVEFNVHSSLTSNKCLTYVLDQPGVCCAVSSPSNIEEIQETLGYFESKGIEYKVEILEITSQI
jgi:predicted aldo/keto reductase-like oxidoreductase